MLDAHATSAPAVSIQHPAAGSILQTIHVRPVPGLAAGIHLDEGVQADAAYVEQLELAWQYLDQIVTTTPLPAFCRHPLPGLTMSLRPAVDVQEGPSHGLAVLLAALSCVLGVPISQHSVITAQLELPTGQAGEICLAPVTGIPSKAVAAGRSGLKCLYYHLRSEASVYEDVAIKRHRIGYFRGEGGCVCLPIPLPRTMMWSSLINIGLDTPRLFHRLLEQGPSAHLLVVELIQRLLPSALTCPASLEEYPLGAGAVVARLRGERRCPPCFPETLPLAYPILLARCPAAAVDDLLKLGISDDPGRAVKSEYRAWIRNDHPDPELNIDTMPLPRSLTLLSHGTLRGHIDHTEAGHASSILCERLHRLAHEPSGDPSARFRALVYLCKTAHALPEVSPEVLRKLIEAVTACSNRSDTSQQVQVKRIGYLFSRRILAPGLACAPKPSHLTLVFGLEGLDQAAAGSPAGGSSVVPIINPLTVRYVGQDGLDVRLRSPVLLVECARALGSYCRRAGFVDADDTLARLPATDASAISQRFGGGARIEFCLQRPSDTEARRVGVWWDPTLTPFPPAIDSQFLAASLQRWCHERGERGDIHSLMDVGCGTGFLAAVAAYLFQAVQRITLIDQDSLTVNIAHDNLNSAVYRMPEHGAEERYDAVAPHAAIQSWGGDFVRYQPFARHHLLVCNPPYLPELQMTDTGMERATNGTRLLEDVVQRGPELARHCMLAFSAMAWPEFEEALARMRRRYRRITVYSRQLVPLRLPPIEPIYPEENRRDEPRAAQRQFIRRRDYYESTLMAPGRDLIDLDDGRWRQDLGTRATNSQVRLFNRGPDGDRFVDASGMTADIYENQVRTLLDDSRGFRFWHESRVVLLDADG